MTDPADALSIFSRALSGTAESNPNEMNALPTKIFKRLLSCSLLLVALWSSPSGLRAAVLEMTPASAQKTAAHFQPFWAQAGSLGAETSKFEAVESRSQQAARVNRTLLRGTIAFLSVFVILRLFLLWLISRNRKKHAPKPSESEA